VYILKISVEYAHSETQFLSDVAIYTHCIERRTIGCNSMKTWYDPFMRCTGMLIGCEW